MSVPSHQPAETDLNFISSTSYLVRNVTGNANRLGYPTHTVRTAIRLLSKNSQPRLAQITIHANGPQTTLGILLVPLMKLIPAHRSLAQGRGTNKSSAKPSSGLTFPRCSARCSTCSVSNSIFTLKILLLNQPARVQLQHEVFISIGELYSCC
ncbi:hypothetical protein CROQUDRAFT_189407 [Cronartium quercuum f. sp. fusiforme G11]|uniref:Uncharacterized protein n=1 Tax=Cronartium quercuum f. sp. fusiforme G11 TaxID=708437 RepID=A0A9P6TA64_9BASI|nr:hypothetical protein CROQUDRAFT_189407 [Cronartium quercuum f. sp. fusiforme G11]